MSCYVHNLPGRLRVRIPAVKGNPVTASRLAVQINAVEGITSVAANPVTGSLLIFYDPAVTNAAACLAVLNLPAPEQVARTQTASSPTRRVASNVAKAAMWYALEKTIERLVVAALF